jgi:valyl-tRNA synthetase
MMHPFIPFVTEEIYQHIRKQLKDLDPLLALRQVQFQNGGDPISHFDEALDWVQKIRNVRAEMQIPPGVEIAIQVIEKSKREKTPLEAFEVIETLTKSKMHPVDHFKQGQFGTELSFLDATLFIPLPKEMLFKECVRLEKQLEAIEKKIEGLTGRLKNPEFVSKAPQALLQTTEEQYRTLLDERIALKNQHEKLLIANSEQNR